jgi:EmrB/QacA subfamily drug resistance transporter
MTTTAKDPSAATATSAAGPRIIPIFVALMVAMLLSSLDQTILGTALPTIVGELDGVQHMLWVATAYILGATVVMPVYGKLGDLFGRKTIFLVALSVFIAGSVLGGFATNMELLIAGRAIQGVGGGGLMILSQAIIADVVPPRDRGKYGGFIGAVFAFSAVVGPLLGGLFTDSLTWRWAFWINIPLGIAAIVTAAIFIRLPKRTNRVKPRIDYLGTVLIAIATTSLVLVTSWGGTEYEWDSLVIIALIVTTVVAAAFFVLAEHNAAEPIIPLSLFRDRNFTITTVAGLLTGVAMFGAIGYMPTFLQIANGINATESGLLLLPMLAGLLVTAIGSGILMSKTGRYKWMPITGAALIGVALVLFSTLTANTSPFVTGVYLFVLGAGLGLTIQVLVLIVQNSVPHRVLGTATAANAFFREIGATVGSAVVGSVFASRLTQQLADTFGTGDNAEANSLTPAAINALPAELHDLISAAYADALTPIYLFLVPLMVIAVVMLFFVKEVPLASTVPVLEGMEDDDPDDADDTVTTPATPPAATAPAERSTPGEHRL